MIANLSPLLLILIIALLSRNMTISIAAIALLFLKYLPLENNPLPFIEKNGLKIGIILLTMATLTPLATEKINTNMIIHAFKTPIGLTAMFTGIFVAWAGSKGVTFMVASPEVITALMIGTVIGVCFFKGVAVGPLIAAGLVSLIAKIIKI